MSPNRSVELSPDSWVDYLKCRNSQAKTMNSNPTPSTFTSTPACPDVAGRRQPEGPCLGKGRGCADGLRHLVPVRARLLARSQSDRNGFLKAESPLARPVPEPTTPCGVPSRHLLAIRAAQLPQARRLCPDWETDLPLCTRRPQAWAAPRIPFETADNTMVATSARVRDERRPASLAMSANFCRRATRSEFCFSIMVRST